MSQGYRYEGMEAELYDALDELSDFEDLPFYLWFAETSPGPVLDLGCGTGRILRPLAEKGLEVVGLDNSQAMLAQARDALGDMAELVEGDMRDFDLGEGRFGMVLIPGFSIQMLLEDEDLDACLKCCRRHLREDGCLIVPTFLPWEMIWDGRERCPLELRREAELEGGLGSLRAYQAWRLDREAQRLQLTNRFERRDATGKILETEEKEMSLRWHLPHEVMERLSEAGFSDVSVYGDFSFDPPEPDSESIIYLARI